MIDIGRVGLSTALHDAAGADHVCIQVLTPDLELPVRAWRDLADAFGSG